MSATKPATPLLECAASLVQKPGNFSSLYVCECGTPQNPKNCPRTIALDAEHHRRAAAYPKLVDALAYVLMISGRINRSGPVFLLDELRAAEEKAANLLRELDEFRSAEQKSGQTS